MYVHTRTFLVTQILILNMMVPCSMAVRRSAMQPDTTSNKTYLLFPHYNCSGTVAAKQTSLGSQRKAEEIDLA